MRPLLRTVLQQAPRFTILLVLFAWSSMASGAPKTIIENAVLDLGHIAGGSETQTEIKIRNDGDAVLEIQRVQSSCPCAQVIFPEDKGLLVPPGQEVAIPVLYVPDNRVGPSGATIAIHTSDPEMPVSIVDLQVIVEVPLIVLPDTGVTWGMHPKGSPLSKELKLISGTQGATFEVVEIKVLDPAIEFAVTPIEEADRKGVKLTFGIRMDAPLGQLSTYVEARVRVNGDLIEIAAPVKGLVIGDVLVIPPSIVSPKTAYTQGQDISEIIVRPSIEGVVPRILDVVVEGPLKTTIKPQAENGEQRIQVSTAENTPGGAQSGLIHVMTTSEDQPIVTIPVYFRAAYPVQPVPGNLVLTGTEEHIVRLENGTGAATLITAVDYDANAVTVSWDESAGAAPELRIQRKGNLEANAGKASVIEVQTDRPGAERLVIPLLFGVPDVLALSKAEESP